MIPKRVLTAIVRGIPNSFVNAISISPPKEPICVMTARSQHEEYVKALQRLNIEVIQLPAEEEFPDCVFVEDNCVVIGNVFAFS